MELSEVPRHSVAHVAGLLQRSGSTVRHVAVEHQIGTLVNPRMRLFSDADIERLKQVMHDSRGRPPKSAD